MNEIETILKGYNEEKIALSKIITSQTNLYSYTEENVKNAKDRIDIIDKKIDGIVERLLVVKQD